MLTSNDSDLETGVIIGNFDDVAVLFQLQTPSDVAPTLVAMYESGNPMNLGHGRTRRCLYACFSTMVSRWGRQTYLLLAPQ